MVDGPSNGELGRLIAALQDRIDSRMGELNSRLDKVVSLDVYTIQSTYIDQRIGQLQGDLQQLRTEADALEDAFEKYQRDEAQRRESDRQKRLYQAVIPVLLALLSVAVAIWAVLSK